MSLFSFCITLQLFCVILGVLLVILPLCVVVSHSQVLLLVKKKEKKTVAELQ